MNKFKEISSTTKVILVWCVVLLGVLIGYSKYQHDTLMPDYQTTIPIHLIDGADEESEFYVYPTSIENALSDLGRSLEAEDSIDVELKNNVKANDVYTITRVTYQEVKEERVVPFETQWVESDDTSFIGTRVKTEGEDGLEELIFNVRYINGKEDSREEIGRKTLKEVVHHVIEEGKASTGDIFSGYLTSYGADCVGCSNRTAAGLYVTINGVKDSGKATLDFNGGVYYVLAADSQFPFGTIVKISNHNYSIPDPFYGIVLDRGGGVKGTSFDVFSGSQRSPLFSGSSGSVTVEVIAMGDGRSSIY